LKHPTPVIPVILTAHSSLQAYHDCYDILSSKKSKHWAFKFQPKTLKAMNTHIKCSSWS